VSGVDIPSTPKPDVGHISVVPPIPPFKRRLGQQCLVSLLLLCSVLTCSFPSCYLHEQGHPAATASGGVQTYAPPPPPPPVSALPDIVSSFTPPSAFVMIVHESSIICCTPADWPTWMASDLVLIERETGTACTLSSAQGVSQGDPLGALMFPLGIRQLLDEHIDPRVRTAHPRKFRRYLHPPQRSQCPGARLGCLLSSSTFYPTQYGKTQVNSPGCKGYRDTAPW
jgi:hypothetical protein